MLFATVIAIAALVIVGASFIVLRRDRDAGLTVDPPDLTNVVDISDVIDGQTVADVGDRPSAAEVDDVPGTAEPSPPSVRERLAGARASLTGFFGSIFSGGIDRTTWDALEEALIRADVGVATSTSIMEAVKSKVEADGIDDAADIPALVQAEMVERLAGFDRSLSTDVVAAGGDEGAVVAEIHQAGEGLHGLRLVGRR